MKGRRRRRLFLLGMVAACWIGLAASLPRFARVKHAQHHEMLAIEPILEDLSRAENLQYELPILLAAGNRPPKPRVLCQDLHSFNYLGRNSRGERWMLPTEEFGESIEVGESLVRPIKPHRSCQR